MNHNDTIFSVYLLMLRTQPEDLLHFSEVLEHSMEEKRSYDWEIKG